MRMEDREYLEKRINYLQEANDALQKEVSVIRSSYSELCRALNETVKALTQVDAKAENNRLTATVLYNRIQNLPYEIFDYRMEGKYDIPHIMTWEKTIDEIVLHKKSICRFGDGEFGIMFGIQRWRFQKNDSRLAERLREVVTSKDENILIGLIDYYGDLSYRGGDADGIRSYITPEVRRQHMQLIDLTRTYANTGISRTGTWEKVRNQKRIWDKKECVFIEGSKTRMGVGNDLFDNTASIQRILCPPESAFDRYDEILEEAGKLSKDKTILIALGPTASVLAYDMAKMGYHAIDIGHADISYEWFLRNGGAKTAVKNKYNNEYPEGYMVEDIHDEVYESQIIADLSK